MTPRFPHSTGAYVFWTRADDDRSFDAYGRLVADLPLHVGGDGTVEAVRTAVALEGIELAADGDDLRALGTGTLTAG